MLKLEELDAVRLVKASLPQRELIGPVVPVEALRLVNELRNQPGAEGALGRFDLDNRARDVPRIHCGDVRQLL